MCGIAGILNFNKASVSNIVLEGMIRIIAHRGPDDQGVFVDSNFGVAHRRLSVIDLTSAGRQPMHSPGGRYIISYNGEVYNFKELKKDLISLGYKFKSGTDTEVVLYSIDHWGLKAVNYFNGMFAVSLWDTKERRLHLFRDRYGIKPLYYAKTKSSVLFASEPKSFLTHPDYNPEISATALVEYLTFQNYLTDRTLFENVFIVPPGKILSFSEDSPAPVVQQYWDFSFEQSQLVSNPNEIEEELNFLFVNAVNRQLVSDVNVGSYLSGGIDSSAITAIASKKLPYISTFTIGFDLNSASGIELAYDERDSAERMSYLYKTQHYEMVLKAGDMERSMQKLVWHLDEPRVGQSYPNYYAAHLASKFSTVVLAGTGGDELFGGYPWRYYRGAGSKSFQEYLDRYFSFWQRVVPASEMSKLIEPLGLDASKVNAKDIFSSVFDSYSALPTSHDEYINQSLYFECKTFLQGLLIVDDKLSMAHGIETRVPFLDNDLVDFATSLPVKYKLANLSKVFDMNENNLGKVRQYFQKTKDGKLLLRKMADRYVPKEISERQKQGFSGPDASWFRGESIEYIRDTLFSPNAHINSILHKNTVQKLLNDHLEGRENRRLLVWSLLCLENWLQIFLSKGWKSFNV